MLTADDPVDSFLGDAVARARAGMRALCPPPKLTLSQWADENFYLSAESSAEPGRWHTLPYQRGIMDAVTDRRVERVTVMKSARVGFTKILNATIGYHIENDPTGILVVQPTVEDAKGYSKEEIAPMLTDCPSLQSIVFEDDDAAKKEGGGKSRTIQHKKFPGGVLSMVGANSGAGFRRISRRVIIFDEVDGYPVSAGNDGDQIALGIKRSMFYHNRKIIAGSTPLLEGASRIETMYLEGDQQRYFVPCPSCGHFDVLVFSAREDGGHHMEWPEGKPWEAYYTCAAKGCRIDHSQKRDMVARGEWRATKPSSGDKQHRSFHIWAAYSFAPNATWGQIAEEFLEAKDNVERLKTFTNTVLGETWKEKGEAPEWERLYNRREQYEIGTVPAGVRFLTCGIDCQKDRWEYEVVGWGAFKESWSISAGVIPGNPEREEDWASVDSLINSTFRTKEGVEFQILNAVIDSGWATNHVYNFTRKYSSTRVIAVKGSDKLKSIVSAPTKQDVTVRGVQLKGGAKVWPVGVNIVKGELYGWLKQAAPESDRPYPTGWCHFPQYDENYFKQLTSEHLVTTVNKKGYPVQVWEMLPGRQNHKLDCRVYARCGAWLAGLDRMKSPPRETGPVAAPIVAVSEGAAVAPEAHRPPPPAVNAPRKKKEKRPSFLGGWRSGR